MNNKKIIFCDIDGTILDGSRNMLNPTAKTKYAFQELTKENYVFISSGRNKALLPENVTSLNPNGYVLCNGAYGESYNKQLFIKQFSQENVSYLVNYVLSKGGFVLLESLDCLYCDSLSNKVFHQFMDSWNMSKENVLEFNESLLKNIPFSISMIGFDSEEKCSEFQSMGKEHFDCYRHSQFTSFDVNVKGIDKGYGVSKVIEELGIAYENTYAFGDGINDIEMLQNVAHPVAMANCNELLYQYHFEKTDDVLEDGFYNYLVEHKLIKAILQ